jgi:hypothetical protein
MRFNFRRRINQLKTFVIIGYKKPGNSKRSYSILILLILNNRLIFKKMFGLHMASIKC